MVLKDTILRLFVSVLLHVAGRKLSYLHFVTSFHSLEHIIIVILIIQNQSFGFNPNLRDR